MLTPLDQWYCDRCGRIIQSPAEGWLEWQMNFDENRRPYYHGFHIIHHQIHSPSESGCSMYKGMPSRADSSLSDFVGPDGLVHLLGFLEPDRRSGSEIQDLHEWAELFRRLHLPYYEEARRYFPKAEADNFFEDTDPTCWYLQEKLQEAIAKYGG